jgi:two-component system response regulator FimZ (fimbrial Z protein)
LLADSDPLFLHGVSSVLGDTFAICGKVSTASECLALVPMTEILLLGFSLACGRNALGLLRKFRDLQPKIVVIVLLSPMTAWMRPRLIAAGAKGVISRRTSPHDLLNLVEDALQGLPLPAIQVRSAREDSTPGSVDLDLLSTRELEIFRLIGQRQSVKAIAALLGISEKTVSAHRENIKLKLGIRRAAALALVASSHALWEAKGADYLQ